MTPESFNKYWKKTYSDSPPIGYYLRERYPNLWFRMHSLPLARRYAESKGEEKEILRRHNSILSDLLGEEGKYVLITTGYSTSPSPAQYYPQLDVLVKDSEYFFSFPKHEFEKDDNPNYWHFFMAERVWKGNSADELLSLVADETVSDILFVGVVQNCVYSPYDGGADIFVKNKSRRNFIKNKFSEWTSKHLLGL